MGINAGTAAGRFPAKEAATLVTLHQAATLPWHQHRQHDRARHTLKRGVPSDSPLQLLQPYFGRADWQKREVLGEIGDCRAFGFIIYVAAER